MIKNNNGDPVLSLTIPVKSNELDRKRGPEEIKAKLLTLASSSISKTDAMKRCNLSFAQMQKYSADLIKKDLLEFVKSNGKNYLKTTKRGKKWLEKFQELRAIENGFVVSETD